jgi:hypothetical protein
MAWLSVPTLLHDPVHGYHRGYYRGVGEDEGLFLFRVDDAEEGENPWRVAESLHPYYTGGGFTALHPAPYTYGGEGVLAPVDPSLEWYVFRSITLGRRILSTSLTEPYLVPAYDTAGEYASGTRFWDWPSSDLAPGQVMDLYPRGLAEDEIRITCHWTVYTPASCYQASDADEWPAGCYYSAEKGRRVFVGSPQWICTAGPFRGERFIREPVPEEDGEGSEISDESASESASESGWSPDGVRYRPFVGSGGHRIEFWVHGGFVGWRILGANGLFYLSEKPPNVVRRWTPGTPSSTVVFDCRKFDEDGNIVDGGAADVRITLYNFVASRAAAPIYVGETSIWR